MNKFMNFINQLETVTLDTVSALIPWLAPLIPAFIAYENMVTVLGFPVWLSLVGALVIESLGLATVHTTLQFWTWNKNKNKSQHETAVWIPALLGFSYIAIVLAVNVMLDDTPITHKVAKTLLSLISVVGAITLAVRSQHKAQLVEYRAQKLERKKAKQVTKVTSNLPKVAESTQVLAESVTDWRRLSTAQRRQVAHMSTGEIIKAYGVSPRTALNWQKNARVTVAKQNGKVPALNGEGVIND